MRAACGGSSAGICGVHHRWQRPDMFRKDAVQHRQLYELRRGDAYPLVRKTGAQTHPRFSGRDGHQ